MLKLCDYGKVGGCMLNEVRLIGKLKGDTYIQKSTGEEVGIFEIEIEDDSNDISIIKCQLAAKEAMHISTKYGIGAMLEVKGKLKMIKDKKYNISYAQVIVEEIKPIK